MSGLRFVDQADTVIDNSANVVRLINAIKSATLDKRASGPWVELPNEGHAFYAYELLAKLRSILEP